MAETIAELRALCDDELIARHDAHAATVQVATNHYLTELARRNQDRQTQAMLELTETMLEYTATIKRLTLVVTIATVFAVLAAFAQVWAAFTR